MSVGEVNERDALHGRFAYASIDCKSYHCRTTAHLSSGSINTLVSGRIHSDMVYMQAAMVLVVQVFLSTL
jgi:hypothetical protein